MMNEEFLKIGSELNKIEKLYDNQKLRKQIKLVTIFCGFFLPDVSSSVCQASGRQG